ncbi:kinase-like domain-containing protein [Phlyctochytrium arcticum]|nr:kinase-like domain-containing protein [Phlyctochytrium arcticum]
MPSQNQAGTSSPTVANAAATSSSAVAQQQQATASSSLNRADRHRSHHHSSQASSKLSYQTGPTIVGGHYKVGKKIGEGSFGIIYEGVNLKSNTPVAIKFEPRKAETPQLRDEYRTYKLLSGCPGIPACYYFGQEGLHSVLVIDLLGPSLEDVFDLCGRKFSVKTVCMLAKRMIRLVQVVHEHNLVYRDIKPDNFLIGRIPRYNETVTSDPESEDPYSIVENHAEANPSPASQIYLVDFGMVKQYRDPRTGVHIPFREKKSLSGTARYMSIHTHLGREQGRRDDMEALGHVFFYLLNGHLPWQGLKATSNRQKYERIGEVKQAVRIDDLGRPNPDEFCYYLEYARSMAFDEEPNYDGACEMIDQVMVKAGIEDDGVFDWMEVLDDQRESKRDREDRRAGMTDDERREDDQRERQERLERERDERYDQERRRQEYEREVLWRSPKLREQMGSYFSSSTAANANAPPPATAANKAAGHNSLIPLVSGSATPTKSTTGLHARGLRDLISSHGKESKAEASRGEAAAAATIPGHAPTNSDLPGVGVSANPSVSETVPAAAIPAPMPAAAAPGGPIQKKKRRWYRKLFFVCGKHRD